MKGDNERKERERTDESQRPKIVINRHIWRNETRIVGSGA